jgi:hypothetical protein
MVRFLFPFLLLFPLVPVAHALKPQVEESLAIALDVQNQLLACWSLPPGYENRSVSVRLAFFGDGTLDGDPELEMNSILTARKYPVLMRSVAKAIESCVPFVGLEALGARPNERFDITVHFQS